MRDNTLYPVNLLDAVNDGEWTFDIPLDINGTIAYIAENLPDNLKKIFERRYQQNIPRANVAKIHDCSSENIRQFEYRILRHFRQPYNLTLLKNGIAKTIETAAKTSAEKILSYQMRSSANIMNNASEKLLTVLKNLPANKTNHDDTDSDATCLCSLPFSNRILNALARYNIVTLEQLQSMDEDALSRVRNLGDKSINEIKTILTDLGLEEK